MRRGLKIGDVLEIETPSGLAYVQYTQDDPGKGQLVRVLPGLYVARPNVTELTQQKELYFAFYLVRNAMRTGQVKLVSYQPVPGWAKSWPVMRHGTWDDSGWFIGDGSMAFSPQNIPKFLKVKDLNAEQRRLSISSYVYPHPAMVKALARGWTPERDEEFDRIDDAERKAREEAQAKENKANEAEPRADSLEHYLYFPERSNAERAAQRLRAKDWAVEVRKGADGESWLTLAQQPAPIEDNIDEVRDELEQLAGELGGEYDGWGTALKHRTNPN